MNDTINISLIGLGRWGKNHLRVLAENLNGVASLVVYDDNNDTLNHWYDVYNNITIASSCQEAIDLTDATIIATPSDSHFEIACMALNGGNDVLIEKPIAASREQGLMLKEAERVIGGGRIVMVDHILLYSEAIATILDMIESGAIGEPEYYRSDRTHFGWKVQSEDVVNSLMIHDIYMIEHLLSDKILSVDNAVAYGGDDVTVFGKTEAGVDFSMRSSWVDYYKRRTIQITGNKGTIVWDDDNKEVIVSMHRIRNGDAIRVDAGDTIIKIVEAFQPLEVVLRHFIHCIETREKPISGLDEGISAVSVCGDINKLINGGS